MPQPCNLDGISMNILEENSAHYFRVQSEREQTLVCNEFNAMHYVVAPVINLCQNIQNLY